jgi:prepilin-type N-terminal cleavage/methylation domain-containing protein
MSMRTRNVECGSNAAIRSARSRGESAPPHIRRGFSIIEILLALSITSILLTALFVSLDASFRAYQATAESASRHTIARLTMHRLMGMIRTGTEFGPFPSNVITDPIIESTWFEFRAPTGQVIRIEYKEIEEALYAVIEPGTMNEQTELLLTGVIPQYDGNMQLIPPFTLHYQRGPLLYRATIDLLIGEDEAIDLAIEGSDVPPIRLIASAMPRNNL